MTTLGSDAAHLPPLHPPRLSSSCDRHPDQHVTGFCATCLRERLASLETPQRKSTSSSLKSIFLRPELRRCKSFSGIRADASSSGGPHASAAFEPQRKSCDVRGRNTLWSLFHQDDTGRVASSSAATGEIDMDPKDAVFPLSSIAAPVLEEEERDEDEDQEIIPAEEPVITADTSREIMEEEEEEEDVELKSMKDHIDLEPPPPPPPPPPKEPTGSSFWLAASVFSKKLQKWRRKQKELKKSTASAQTDKTRKPSRETQAVDAFGRRSCDVDPRFSLDAGRMSVDEPRFSWDAPRASWDGHLIGGRSMFARFPPMLAVGEGIQNLPAIERWDGRIPVEEDSTVPGGSSHTRDYYLDSSSSRRRSLDRSDSTRKQSVDFSELKPASNARVSPAGGTEFFHLYNGVKHDGNYLRDDRSESFESAFRESQKGASKKKSKRWNKAWNIWGFIYRRGSSRERGDGSGNEIDKTFSEPWPEVREHMYNGKIFRSNSSVSMRNSSFRHNSGFGSMRRSSLETNSHGKKRRGEFVLERNRSARYSPNHIDNGMLRFYLTPMRGSRRNGMSGKSRHNNYSITKTMLGMY